MEYGTLFLDALGDAAMRWKNSEQYAECRRALKNDDRFQKILELTRQYEARLIAGRKEETEGNPL